MKLVNVRLKSPFTLCSRLYNRLHNRLYNRLYNRLQSVNGLLSRTLTSLNNNSDFHLLDQYSPSNRTLLFFHRCDQNHRQYSLRFAVTHLSTNRARRGVTLLMHNAVTEARPPAPVVTCSTDVSVHSRRVWKKTRLYTSWRFS